MGDGGGHQLGPVGVVVAVGAEVEAQAVVQPDGARSLRRAIEAMLPVTTVCSTPAASSASTASWTPGRATVVAGELLLAGLVHPLDGGQQAA